MEYKKHVLFLRLKGNLNSNTSSYFSEYTMPIIDEYNIKYLVINLNSINTIDNKGYLSLKNSIETVKSNKGKVLIIDNNNYYFDNELVALKLLKV